MSNLWIFQNKNSFTAKYLSLMLSSEIDLNSSCCQNIWANQFYCPFQVSNPNDGTDFLFFSIAQGRKLTNILIRQTFTATGNCLFYTLGFTYKVKKSTPDWPKLLGKTNIHSFFQFFLLFNNAPYLLFELYPKCDLMINLSQ